MFESETFSSFKLVVSTLASEIKTEAHCACRIRYPQWCDFELHLSVNSTSGHSKKINLKTTIIFLVHV